MDCHCIPHSSLPHVSRLFTDYLYETGRLSEFLPHNPFAKESFANAARSLRYENGLRREVVEILREQNRRFSAGEAAFESLRKLESPDCYAVVTGQQVGLFSGPAFAIYKALTAIKLARSLSERGLQAVPVFWLATEDHDLEEVNHCHVQDGAGNPQRLEYSEPPPAPGASAGTVAFTETIRDLHRELGGHLSGFPGAAQWLGVLEECYRPGETFGSSYGRFMARLFAEFGVVLVDPLDARLHRLSAGVFRAAVGQAADLRDALLERSRLLAERGYHAQVRVAENSSLLFLQSGGQRRAVRLQDGRFDGWPGFSESPEELLQRLDREPEAFSPNVLLRPVMQDCLLPTIAYVGGPSEIAYFAQAGVVYERVLGRMPVVFPRASFTVLDAPATRSFKKYGLSLTDVYAGKQALREKMAARFLPAELMELFRTTRSGMEENLAAVREALTRLDPTLADAAANSSRKIDHQLSTLERKAGAAVESRTEQIERDALRLENSLYPHKTPQERFFSGIQLLARYGPDFLNRIYEQIPLHSAGHQVVSL